MSTVANHNPPSSNHRYRADIDGLRAIAVLSVLGFHLFPERVTGGFIGVDIFFVISGYLITSMILTDLQKSAFSIIDFYTRRINRIFPALILVLIFIFMAGWYLLTHEKYSELNKHMMWACGFLYNILLLNDGGYFSTAAESRPLLHLWSLGIEEQFYICWPIMLIAAWKFRKWQGVITLVVITMLISFLTSIFTQNKVIDFYSPVSRFWELLIGGFLAYLTLKHHHFSGRASNIASLAGVLFLIGGLVFINKSLLFPGWLALLPTLGAFLLISAGPQAWFNNKVLSNKFFVWVGLISYPLYLWHWPLLSFFRLFHGEELSIQNKVILGLISVLLATLTYLFVEKEMRSKRYRKIKSIFLIVIMIVIGSISFLSYRGYFMGNDQISLSNLEAKGDHPTAQCWEKWLKYVRGYTCYLHDIHEVKRPAECYENAKPSIAIWGDSHAAALYPGFKKLGMDKHFGIIEVSQAGCPPIFDLNKDNIPFRENCNEVNENVFKSLINIKPDIIILHAAWQFQAAEGAIYSLTDDELTTKFDSTVKKIKNSLPNAKIIVLGPVPRWETSPEQVVYLNKLKSGASLAPIRQKAKQLDNLDAILQKISIEAGVDFISINKTLCDESGCVSKAIEDQQTDYIACDYGHFTEVGSEYFVDQIKNDLLPLWMRF